jgi:hypothetical protein
MVVLGCAVSSIQNERVNVAIDYVSKNNDNTEFVWFVTGGVKNSVNTLVATEADRMRTSIVNNMNKVNHKIVLDEKARNTAENFAYLKKWLRDNYDDSLPEIVITTSEFHKERASKIFNGMFEDVDPQWNLSKSNNCPTCWTDELIHMKNVDNDINNAKNII